MVERLLCKQDVAGSNPVFSTVLLFFNILNFHNKYTSYIDALLPVLIGRHYLYQYGIFGKSYKGHMADALALVGDEGRGYLR